VEKPLNREVIVTFPTEPIDTLGYDFSACGQAYITAAPEGAHPLSASLDRQCGPVREYNKATSNGIFQKELG
jgi:hypothetical protein